MCLDPGEKEMAQTTITSDMASMVFSDDRVRMRQKSLDIPQSKGTSCEFAGSWYLLHVL